ncbi:hypothetical protein, partial [Bacillus subtilis]|uniref:hypothetical protein n=1 Tax=Bacillus subtilis TaxID=1423 RepID=UPI00197BC539
FSPEAIFKQLDKFTDSFMKKVDDIASKPQGAPCIFFFDKFTDSFMKKVDDIASKFSPEAIFKQL